jgi:hypothetical protein
MSTGNLKQELSLCNSIIESSNRLLSNLTLIYELNGLAPDHDKIRELKSIIEKHTARAEEIKRIVDLP